MEAFDKSAALNKSEPMRELQNLAYMYYAMGNYAKSEEILALIKGMEERHTERLEVERRWDERRNAA